MLTFSGELTRLEYFRQLGIAYVLYIGGALVILLGMDVLNANRPDANLASQIIATLLFAALIAVSLIWLFVIVSLVVKRARNIGYTLRWTLSAILLIQLGVILIGFIPPARKHLN